MGRPNKRFAGFVDHRSNVASVDIDLKQTKSLMPTIHAFDAQSIVVDPAKPGLTQVNWRKIDVDFIARCDIEQPQTMRIQTIAW